MSVPMVDLKVQYESIREEINTAVLGVMQSTHFILGHNGKALEESVAAYHGVKHAIGVASGTDALHLALIAAGIKRGDEIITTPFTFIATAEAASYIGAVPVFVDIDPSTFNIDASEVEKAVTPRTRAIIPVHLYGQPADMDPIMAIAKDRRLKVIEDCAQSFGAVYKGRKTGTIGDIGCFSFFPSKNLGCYGDGGMVITDDPALAERMIALRNHGSRVRYYHEEVGFNSRLDEIQAAVLGVKLKYIDAYNERRRSNALLYSGQLSVPGIRVPAEQKDTRHVFHQYTIRIKNRDVIKQKLDAGNVISSMIYYPVPLHLQKAYAGLGMKPGSLPNAEQAAGEVLSLPMYPELSPEQIRLVADTLKQAL